MNDGIKLVLFDFDDTLVSTIGPKWEQHKHVARLHFGKELTNADILLHWGKPLREYLCRVYETDDVEHAVNTNALYEADFPKTLLGPISDIVWALKESGIFVGIVTANLGHFCIKQA
jgi:phosphoglycolate phosphatase-like HAD superfamily hydrolase